MTEPLGELQAREYRLRRQWQKDMALSYWQHYAYLIALPLEEWAVITPTPIKTGSITPDD